MPRPKMPRGVHQDRASFPGMVSTRIVNSEGEVEGYIILSHRLTEQLPEMYDDMLWGMLDAIDPAVSADRPVLKLA